MQLVGTDCHACGKPIAFNNEGIGCPVCSVAMHRACVQEGNRCPVCGEDMLATASREEAAQKREIDSAVASGRWQMHLCLALLAGVVFCDFMTIAGTDWSGLMTPGLWLHYTLLVGLAYGTFTGRTPARVGLTIMLLIKFIQNVMGWQKIGGLIGPLVDFNLIGNALCSVGVILLLTFSPNLHFFLAAQRQRGEER